MEKYGFYVIYIIFLGHAMCLPNGKILTKEEMENLFSTLKKNPKELRKVLKFFVKNFKITKRVLRLFKPKLKYVIDVLVLMVKMYKFVKLIVTLAKFVFVGIRQKIINLKFWM